MPLTMATPSTIAIAVSAVRSLRPRRPSEREGDHRAAISSIASPISCWVAPGELADDATVGEEEDAVGDRSGPRFVGDHHDRLPEVLDRVAEQLEDLGARRRVEVAGRLVGEHDVGLGDERPRDRDALLLAAGELRPVGARAGRRARRSRRAPRTNAGVGLLARDREREPDVLLGVQHRQEVEELEDEADVLAPELRQVGVLERRDLRAGDRRPSPRSACRARRGCASASTCRSPKAPSPR